MSGLNISDINGPPLPAYNGGPTFTVALEGSGAHPAVETAAALTTTSAALSASDTSVKVAASKFLYMGQFLQIESEIVEVTAINLVGGTTLTLLRGQDGTTAAAHSSGASLLLATDQRELFRNTNPDLGAFETQFAAVSNVTMTGSVYTGSAISVASATVTDASNQTISPPLKYVYYAGTLSASQALAATPLSGPPVHAGNHTVVVNLEGYRSPTTVPTHFSITPAALTIDAVSNTKVYDASTTASATPTVSGLLVSDTVSGLH